MFKTLTDGCKPTRGSKFSACVDLYASEDMVIGAGETKLIGLGIAIDENFIESAVDGYAEFTEQFGNIPYRGDSLEERIKYFKESHYLQLMLRSSLSKELIIGNGVGVIDLDYKDEIKIRLHNPLEQYAIKENGVNKGYTKITSWFKINKGDRIAQITLLEHKGYLFGIESEDERTGGFGSTDKKEIE